MSDEPTDNQIALLCDIGEHDLLKASEQQKREMDRLIATGYVEPVDDDTVCPVRLTPTFNYPHFWPSRFPDRFRYR